MQNLTSLQTWQIQYSLRQHKQRLKEIKNEKLNTSVAGTENWNPRKSKRTSFAERELAKENEIIIKKLQQQTTRKPDFGQQVPEWPKTLNAAHRNQEARRIAKENERFVQRIHEKPSVISARNLESEFKKNREYVRIRSKTSIFKLGTKLPALKQRAVLEEEPVQGEPLQYSTNFTLMSITPLPELGMDGPMEVTEISEESFVETE